MGVFSLIPLAISRLISMPHSWAIAGRCSILLVEQPSAISTVRALRKASSVMMSRGRISFSTSFITAIPACFASLIRAEYTAGMVPLPFSPIPRTSVRQFMELAVYIPEQEPQVGQVLHSNSSSFSRVILPALNSPTASEMEEKLVLAPSMCPASIGPPLTKTVGRFSRAAAIRSPGTFLSQFGTITSPSKPCAIAIASVESAIRSRVTSEYFMPVCPMAMPSHTAIAGNTTGVPPAMATPIFTASTILSRFICPGTISL